MTIVAALFVRQDSIYKTMPGVDAWDAERDARRWPGGCPVIAHPPCRARGAFAWRANPRPGERDLAVWAVAQVRAWGGVLEHPAGSALWPEHGLPEPGAGCDQFGGWTIGVNQHEFGHRALKPTRLYIAGCSPRDIPPLPLVLGRPECVIGDVGRASLGTKRREIPKAEREATPPEFARWLVDLAGRCRVMERAA